jgi:DNA-binding CsgD family transcriptional regulator
MRSARFTLLLERPDANDAPRARLLEAIRVVRGGEALLSSITRWLIEDFAARTDPLEPPKALLEQITPREREVLVPVARGLSNGEIAERLVATQATVKSHVGSILTKLDLRDRVQAVVFAYEHGIVTAGRTRLTPGPASEQRRSAGGERDCMDLDSTIQGSPPEAAHLVLRQKRRDGRLETTQRHDSLLSHLDVLVERVGRPAHLSSLRREKNVASTRSPS